MKKNILILICNLFILITALTAQTVKEDNFSGVWKYEVKNTPYGNYYGTISLTKLGNKYNGYIVNNHAKKFKVNVLRVKNNKIVFGTDLEETNSIVYCTFSGDSLKANIDVKGDDFPYKLKAKRISKTVK